MPPNLDTQIRGHFTYLKITGFLNTKGSTELIENILA